MTDRPDKPPGQAPTLWGRTSAKGRRYFSDFVSDVQISTFEAGEITRPKGEVVQTWKLLVQEKDPDRRAAPRPEQPTCGQATGDPSRDHGDEP